MLCVGNFSRLYHQDCQPILLGFRALSFCFRSRQETGDLLEADGVAEMTGNFPGPFDDHHIADTHGGPTEILWDFCIESAIKVLQVGILVQRGSIDQVIILPVYGDVMSFQPVHPHEAHSLLIREAYLINGEAVPLKVKNGFIFRCCLLGRRKLRAIYFLTGCYNLIFRDSHCRFHNLSVFFFGYQLGLTVHISRSLLGVLDGFDQGFRLFPDGFYPGLDIGFVILNVFLRSFRSQIRRHESGTHLSYQLLIGVCLASKAS